MHDLHKGDTATAAALGTQRRGDWIQMHSGIAFWPMDPLADEVRLEDIAHSLSLLCRFGGHCSRFYSVAEHSVHVARLCSPEVALWGLLHDASEAYVVDMPRPIKRMLPEYAQIEGMVQLAIAEHFGLPAFIPPEVKFHDEAMLMCEAAKIMGPPPMPWIELGHTAAEVDLQCWTPAEARAAFLEEFILITSRLSLS